MNIPVPSKIGRYEIIDKIGEGGMGTVFRAKLPTLERVVALKILSDECLRHPDLVERFRLEANLLARMDHPNIVKIFDLDEHQQRLFYVMEYLPRSLADEVYLRDADGATKGVRLIGFRLAAQWIVQIADGLAAIHKQGVVHRDLSPQNILIDEDRTAKISDFGIAKQLGCEGVTKTGLTGIGKEMYVAPEQWVDFKRADARSDIYSTGVVFYILLTGRLPVGRFDPPSEMAPHIPPDLDRLVLRCLDYQPEGRQSDGAELQAELAALDLLNAPDMAPQPQARFGRSTPTPGPVSITPTRPLTLSTPPEQPLSVMPDPTPPPPLAPPMPGPAAGISPLTVQPGRGLAIAAFALLLPLCLWPTSCILAMVLGLLNLRRIERRPELFAGRGLSLAAAVIGLVELLLIPLGVWLVYVLEWPDFAWDLLQAIVGMFGYEFV